MVRIMKLKPLRILDNTKYNSEIFYQIENLTRRIVNKTLSKLEDEDVFVFPEIIKDAEDLSSNQMILQSINDEYYSGNVMGFIGLGNERLIIGSRFSSGERDYFFQYLLNNVLDFPNIIDLNTDANQNNPLLGYLLFLFPYYLRKAMRKGMFKEYVCNRYNDMNLKGSIDLKRHIDKNTPFMGKIAYTQREFSYDNSLTELIRHTIEFIKTKKYGNTILFKARDEVSQVVNMTTSYTLFDRRKIIEQNRKNRIIHAYFHEYSNLQKLCLAILQDQKHQIGFGSNQIYGILFDGAWLWEEYMYTLINQAFYHPMNKSGKGAQWLFVDNRKRVKGKIYPDFISKDYSTRVIADAKYKPMDNIGNKDYMQVLAYMFRFDAKVGYYLFPNSKNDEDLVLCLNSGTTYDKNLPRKDIFVIKHGLSIPIDESNYDAFVKKMSVSEYNFKCYFCRISKNAVFKC